MPLSNMQDDEFHVASTARRLRGLVTARTSGWHAAPSCAQLPASNTTPDKVDPTLLWGFESSRPCAYRGADGRALTAYDVAPSCSMPLTAPVVQDSAGRAWSWSEAGKSSCKVPHVLSTSTNPAAPATSQPAPVTWEAAPDCPQDLAKSQSPKVDSEGRYWGWANGKSCRLQAQAPAQQQPAAQPAPAPTQQASASGPIDSSYPTQRRCPNPPTWSTATPNKEGVLYGQDGGQPCVYRDTRGYLIFLVDLQQNTLAGYNAGERASQEPGFILRHHQAVAAMVDLQLTST